MLVFKKLLILLPILIQSCSWGLPEKSYSWNPKLRSTKGQIGDLLKGLPLGEPFYALDDHPNAKKEKAFILTNAKELVPFMSLPKARNENKIHTKAFSIYTDSKGEVKAAILGVLWKKPLDEKILKKEKVASSNPGALVANLKTVMFYIQEVTNLFESSKNSSCRFYQVSGDKDYLLMSAYKRNLQLEIALRGKLPEKSKNRSVEDKLLAASWQWPEKPPPPYEVDPSKSKKILEDLIALYDEIGLRICQTLNKDSI